MSISISVPVLTFIKAIHWNEKVFLTNDIEKHFKFAAKSSYISKIILFCFKKLFIEQNQTLRNMWRKDK